MKCWQVSSKHRKLVKRRVEVFSLLFKWQKKGGGEIVGYDLDNIKRKRIKILREMHNQYTKRVIMCYLSLNMTAVAVKHVTT